MGSVHLAFCPSDYSKSVFSFGLVEPHFSVSELEFLPTTILSPPLLPNRYRYNIRNCLSLQLSDRVQMFLNNKRDPTIAATADFAYI